MARIADYLADIQYNNPSISILNLNILAVTEMLKVDVILYDIWDGVCVFEQIQPDSSDWESTGLYECILATPEHKLFIFFLSLWYSGAAGSFTSFQLQALFDPDLGLLSLWSFSERFFSGPCGISLVSLTIQKHSIGGLASANKLPKV